ncbi:MAG: single-stranded-DNA-specific exonuclease RecJ [Cyanobacteria bacterium P01_D01_bin.73]
MARARSLPREGPPPEFVDWVRSFLIATLQKRGRNYRGSGKFAAQLLWQRQDLWTANEGQDYQTALAQFLDPDQYEPTPPEAFGPAIATAVQRLVQARDGDEKVAIWGDFDADGLTATAVLFEGLGGFFECERLSYTIPNRLTESHGLNESGLRSLADQGVTVVVTCDTGSTNLAELTLAQELGIDVIVTDHHTLPDETIPALAVINPRSLPTDHPLATLSGVAVAFKLVEALYAALPEVPTRPLENLLDLVAIGLIADLVELRGDCRYLAQRGIQQLQKTQRAGLRHLLEACKRQGDRPTDISFGIGPRINAISRIHGDAQFGVALLTSTDAQECRKLASETELANSRRKELQRRLVWDIEQQLGQVDRSTTHMLVLAEAGWPVGILGLVAGQIAERWDRPVLLLAIDGEWARGSARSVAGLDLYEILHRHQHLLHRYGGHPMAAGVMMKAENVALLTQALNHDLGQRWGDAGGDRSGFTKNQLENQADLTVTVDDLGQELFQELKLIEPCGMGNPQPKLLIKNAWFTDVYNANIKDSKNTKLKYIRTLFNLCDDTNRAGCSGTWWEHYRDEVPQGKCDVLVELDFNTNKKQYEVRLLALKAIENEGDLDNRPAAILEPIRVYDWRSLSEDERYQAIATCAEEILEVPICPQRWEDWQDWIKRAIAHDCALALTYSGQPQDVVDSAQKIYTQFMGLAKYLVSSETGIYRDQIQNKLKINSEILMLGFDALKQQQISVQEDEESGYLSLSVNSKLTDEFPSTSEANFESKSKSLIAAIQEDIFQRNYFSTIPVQIVKTLNSSLISTSNNPS